MRQADPIQSRGFGVLAMALALTAAACGGPDEAAKAESKPAGASTQTVSAAVAAVENLPRVVSASGTVSAWEEVPVAAESGGLTATGVFVDEGDYVRQGELLVKLNDTLLRTQQRQQEAQVAAAAATLAQQTAALTRARELEGRGFVSRASLDAALANQQVAAAQLNSARALSAEVAARLEQTSIRAPVSGLVVSRSVTLGQIVQPGVELFRVVRDGRLELDAQVPETELALIRSGQPASIASDQVGSTRGQVRIVTSEVDAQTRLGVARITLAGAGGFRPGMFARAQIEVGAQPVVTVPTGAVLYRDNKAGVFALSGDGRARFQSVSVLSRRGTQTAVDGLSAGARVVVDGAGFVGEGDRVTVAAAPAAVTRTASR